MMHFENPGPSLNFSNGVASGYSIIGTVVYSARRKLWRVSIITVHDPL